MPEKTDPPAEQMVRAPAYLVQLGRWAELQLALIEFERLVRKAVADEIIRPVCFANDLAGIADVLNSVAPHHR